MLLTGEGGMWVRMIVSIEKTQEQNKKNAPFRINRKRKGVCVFQ